ncbi:MAG: 4-hydroxythreonine-4-phosphate dehydrogenase PdxA [Coleofasciculaceae cyanobacterium RL_1_1]|nr:4-hydroxythreonine-4-phosphate dehydrogenase PdxA [Coleofasciculaceae cyanobacterium RL_1_1]
MTHRSLAITIGDPAGIGPEVILKAFAQLHYQPDNFILIGHRSILEATALRLNLSKSDLDLETWTIIEPSLNSDLDLAAIQSGNESAISGAASFAYLNRAIDFCLDQTCGGIVTAPISKTAWKAAGHHYPGQTELLAERAQVERFGMMFVAKSPHTGWSLRTLLATTHIPLASVPTTLTPELLDWKLDLAIQTLRDQFGLDRPRIAISGLNPHSGENGQLGREEADWMNTWLATARTKHPQADLTGLVPPDTLWVKPGQAWYGDRTATSEIAQINAHDLYFALYHDQGLIPTKLLAFDLAVNTTIGLPFIRTSPDHGTAFDIAGRGIADPTSTIAAINLAIDLAT